jgi:acetyl-CoA carboxylase carboxyl transferase subunit alpha
MMTTILPHEKQIFDYEKSLQEIKKQMESSNIWTQEDILRLEKKLELLKKKVYSNLTPWERVAICRHPQRPHTSDYIKHLCDGSFEEIYGDRLFRDDPAIITGFGKINTQKFAFVGLEKGKDTESRLHRNFGMAHPEGYKKALRCMKLAEKFSLPVVSFIDTQGAYPGLTAEERGQGWAIANNLFEMASLSTPIIVVLIGEGCSGGALGIGIGDVIGMLEHAYYSVISPEGCAAILWKDSSMNAEAAAALKMQAEDLLKLNIIDVIIKEPPGGAHLDPNFAYNNVRHFILEEWELLKVIEPQELIERRYQKFRSMGKFSRVSNNV